MTLLGGEKGANRSVREFGWEIAHEAVSPRPPNSLDTIAARTEGYTYDAKDFWICASFETENGPRMRRPFSVAPLPNPNVISYECMGVGFGYGCWGDVCGSGLGSASACFGWAILACLRTQIANFSLACAGPKLRQYRSNQPTAFPSALSCATTAEQFRV